MKPPSRRYGTGWSNRRCSESWSRSLVATRQGWSRGSQGCDDLAKPRLSSSGCETRPAWVSPLESVASLAPAAATSPAMRRHASVWAVGDAATKRPFRVPRTSKSPKASGAAPRMGKGRAAPGGVFDHGTHEEDGPGTWEALVSPRMDPGPRRPGDQTPTRRVERVPARPAAPGTEPGIRAEAGR